MPIKKEGFGIRAKRLLIDILRKEKERDENLLILFLKLINLMYK